MILNKDEITEHFTFYIEDCKEDNLIPLSYEEWQREILPDLINILKERKWNNDLK